MSSNSSAFLVFTVDSPEARQNLQSGSLGSVYCDYYLYRIQSVQSTPLGIWKFMLQRAYSLQG